jgi:3-oxoacyl-[acyl-carrier protein] reductase
MDLGISGKSALVTGGSKGIGLACAESLAAEGCHLHLAARNPADLDTARRHLASRYRVEVTTHAVDLSRADAAVALGQSCGELDILVNNAGAVPRRSLLDSDDAEWRQSWDLKVYGFINLTREIYRTMCGRGRGAIVNVVGITGETPNANSIMSTVGNAALLGFTRALGSESVDKGIRVVAVNPGLVLTDRTKSLLEGGSGPDAAAWGSLVQRLPFKRMAHAREVGDVVAFLASERASYVSGTMIAVDGGGALGR